MHDQESGEFVGWEGYRVSINSGYNKSNEHLQTSPNRIF